jgi:pimeloyl-ACP methyl ester carboxylesterase
LITPDFRGRGQSDHDADPGRYQHQTYVDDVWKLLDALDIKKCTIVGTSMGGWLAMLMAAAQPGRIQAVVLNDIGPVIPDDAVRRIMTYVGRVPPVDSWNNAAARLQQTYGSIFADKTGSFWLNQARQSMRESADGMIVPDMDPAIGETLRRDYDESHRNKGLNEKDEFGKSEDKGYWEQFRAITMPCLLLHGEKSDVLTAEIVSRMKQLSPHMHEITIANRGHTPTLDEPLARTSIDEFLFRVLAK